jgi:large subunit ribosomal protein L13
MAVINAENLVLGRLASHVAKRLLKGEDMIIVNAEKVIITGSKKQILKDYQERRARGSKRKGPYYPRMPDRLLKRTIRGMIPYQKPHGRTAYKRLRVYVGIPKELAGEEFEEVKVASEVRTRKYVHLGEISKELGAKF